MSEVEKLLADVPALDPHFVLGVMRRIEQRRFRRELVRTGALAAAAILLLALVMPKVELAMPQVNMAALADLASKYNIAIAAVLMIVTILLPRFLRG
jgi:hypothetical protein